MKASANISNNQPQGSTQKDYKYQYNAKEFQDELGLNWNSLSREERFRNYGARNYDAAIRRWMNVDPLAEKYVSISTFAYVANLPTKFIDPDGKEIVDPNGKRVRYRVKKDGTIKFSKNATDGTKTIITWLNKSPTGKEQLEAWKNSENKIYLKKGKVRKDNSRAETIDRRKNDNYSYDFEMIYDVDRITKVINAIEIADWDSKEQYEEAYPNDLDIAEMVNDGDIPLEDMIAIIGTASIGHEIAHATEWDSETEDESKHEEMEVKLLRE